MENVRLRERQLMKINLTCCNQTLVIANLCSTIQKDFFLQCIHLDSLENMSQNMNNSICNKIFYEGLVSQLVLV